MYEQKPDKTWELSGKFIDFPACLPIADVPREGYTGPGVPAERSAHQFAHNRKGDCPRPFLGYNQRWLRRH